MQAHGLVVSETAHRAARPALARHFLEMVAAMWVGMVVGGLIPAMLAVVLFRRDEYSQSHRAHGRR